MKIASLFEKHEYILSFLTILVVVTVTNLHAVFGLDMLFLDDNARYYLFVNDQYKISDPRSFIGLLFLLKWIPVYIFSTYSVELARLYILLVYMVPLSCLFYYFNRNFLKLSAWVSLASAVIINIIPKQYVIPTFLDGSYPVSGMLFFLTTLIISAQYLRSSRSNIILLISASILWLLVCDLIAEMGIFLYPALLYFIYSAETPFKRKAYLYTTTFAITALRLYSYFQTVGINPTNKPADLTLQVTTRRIVNSIEWWLPFGKGTTTTIIIGIIVATFLTYAIISAKRSSKLETNIQRAYIFYGIWFLSCSFPFWFLSKYFGPRYFYISYFALTTVAFIALYQVFLLPRHNKKRMATMALLAIFCFYGVQRYLINDDQFTRGNRKNDAIYAFLSSENINDNTQIALVNIKNGTGGYYMWSSGYLQYLLKKPEIRGVMGNDKNFYNPFNLKHCGYSYTMSCLDINKELIAFKQDANYKTHRMNYFLQWHERGNKDSLWTLYSADEKNRLSIATSGKGLETYKSALSKFNLDTEQVLWGNLNDKKSLESLI